MSLHLSAIDQAKRPDFVPAPRRDDESDRGFSDLLRDSVDRVRDMVLPERRFAPRAAGEQAVPTAREAREVAAVTARQARRLQDSGKADSTGKPDLTDVTQAKRELPAGFDETGDRPDATAPIVRKIKIVDEAQGANEPAKIVVAPASDEDIAIVVDPTGAPVPVALLHVANLPAQPLTGQDGNSPVPTDIAPGVANGDAPVSAPIGFAELVAATAPLAQPLPETGAVPAATSEAAVTPNSGAAPVPGFVPVTAPTANAQASVQAAITVTATVVAAAAVPVPTPSAPSAAPATGAPVVSADGEGATEGAAGLPADTIVTVTNQAQVLVAKPIRIDGQPLADQPDDAGEAAVPTPLAADAAELPADGELPVVKSAPTAGAPGAADDGLSQPLAAGAVSTAATQPDVTATQQPTTTQAVAAPAVAAAEPMPTDAEAPITAAEPAAATTSTHASSHASTTAQAHAADQARFNRADATARNAMPQHVADQVAVHIAKAIKGGDDSIKINLRPESLGQIEVQLKIGADGRVQAVVQVDKPETMELMQRDARGLERALQDAGLKTDSGSLSFNLRGQDQQREHARNEFSGNGGAGGVDVVAPEDEISAVEAMVALSRANGGIDVRV